MQHRGKNALFTDEAFGLQVVQHGGQVVAFLQVPGQLALQLGARMLALGEQTQRTAFERGLRADHFYYYFSSC